MRSYPHNSPEAAARIVALVLLSDGNACKSEFDVLKLLGAERELGLDPQLLPHLVYTLHDELLIKTYVPSSLLANVDDDALAALMAEVSDPALQRTVLRLSLAAAQADGHLADGETLVLEAVRRHWRLIDGAAASVRKSTSRHDD